MGTSRTISAPGVELREYDRSDYTGGAEQTAVLVNGFTSQGEENTTMQITSKTALINQFGKPTNEAERYFYAACNEVLNQGGKLFATRVPYDNASAGKYNSVIYKIAGDATNYHESISSKELELALADIIGTPRNKKGAEISSELSSIESVIETSDSTISSILNIEFSYLSSLGDVDSYITEEEQPDINNILIIDKLRGQYTKTSDGKECLGIIPVITTATNALFAQDLLDNADYKLFSPVDGFEYLSYTEDKEGGIVFNTHTLSTDELAIPFMTKDFYGESVSRMVARQFPAIGYITADRFEKEYFKHVGVVVLKAYVDPSSNNLVNFEIVESFIGSLDPNGVDSVTGKTNFIDTVVNATSQYIYLFSNADVTTLNKASILNITAQPMASLGFNADAVKKTISLSSINNSLNIIFEKNSDIHEKEIDIVVDAGMSNIAQYVFAAASKKPGSEVENTVVEFDPIKTKISLDNKSAAAQWLSIVQKYDNFCKNIRKDCMFICDGIRALGLTAAKKVIRPSKPTNTIDSEILPKMKYMSGMNSNYTAGYCDWFQIADDTTGKLFWCPPSVQAMGCYIYTDINYNVWDAPAGQRRGVITALDCAFSPSLQQAGAIYDKAWNYAVNYADVGLILEGQKTMQQKQSAFDRVNVRRLFLNLERKAYNIARTFVYEPNNAYTRQRLADMLDPVFAVVKANGGCYDYKIICDESVNTPEVIDRNELRVKIGVKPTKTAEFILVEFYALRTNGSWDEMGA